MKTEYCKKLILTNDIKKELKKLKPKKNFSGKVISEYYDFKDNSLEKKGILIRLRKKGKIAELTLKQKEKSIKNGILRTKLKKEIKSVTTNFKGIKEILRTMNLKIVRKESFYREEYFKDEVIFEIKNKKELELESYNLKKLNKVLENLK
ncbi:MAG: CYTH domain-containing protein [Nanoarchaeota archaeon]|nr:CYTH domain-containing protein [Nanoarchaeota archaeon]